MRRTAPLLALLLALAAARGARAGDGPLSGLSGERAKAFAADLASDDMKGRKTGFEGGDRADAYLQKQARAMGLAPMDRDGNYLHPFRFGATEVMPPIALEVDGKPAEYGKDFVDLVYTGAGTAEAEVVFVGFGIAAKDRGWDDYDGVDVKGKIVLALRGAPAAREAEFATERQIGWKSAAAADRGAAGFLVAEGATAVPGTIQEAFHRAGLPAVWVAGPVADRILAPRGRTLADLKATRDAGEPGRSFATGTRVRLEVNGRFRADAEGHDVLAGIRGSDPALAGELILVGAHADHLGTDAQGRVYNGADDNASGCAVLLALAETLSRNGWRPRRTVVFAWFGGEEQGLVGSRRLAEDVPFPRGRPVAMINVDMAGRGKGEVAVGGGDAYPDLYDLALSAQPEAVRASVKPFRAEGNSDHWPFFERGIPALFAVSVGEHPNYHRVTDDAESLDPPALLGVASFVGRALVALADRPEPLATGREAAGYVLREGPRAVEGPASLAELRALLAAPPEDAAARAPLVRAGRACVVVPVDERDGGAAVAWASLAVPARARPKQVALVLGAGDLVNAPRSGRTAVLARLHCAESASRLPEVLSVYRDMGVRWVAPFDAGRPLEPAARDAILATAESARLVVDLTGLPDAGLDAARARGDRFVATYRAAAPLADDPQAAAAALRALRARLGPRVLLLVGGPADRSLLAPAALSACEAPAEGLAPVAVLDEDTAGLTDLLAVPAGGPPPAYANPSAPERARLRGWFGGALVDLLRRL